MTRRLLFLADSASQLKPAYTLASAFRERHGWEIVGNLLPGNSMVSNRQLLDADVRCPITAHSLGKLATMGLFSEFDAVVAFLPGSRLHALLAHIDRSLARKNASTRPALITGYNGVVYEGYLEGLLWRTGYDFVCVNSRADQRLFTSYLDELDHSGERLIATGFLLAQGGVERLRPYGEMPNRDILFATQAIVPARREEREYILEGLRSYAEAFPDRKVIIKPRALPGERTFHEERHHYALLYDGLYGQSKPANLLFGYGSLDSYLDRVGLVLSVSSTAVIEALSRGVPGAILGDFGLKESLGNHFFRNSGMVTTIPDLIGDRVPAADPDWLLDNGFAPDDSVDLLVDGVMEFCEAQASSGRRTPMLSPYYDGATAPYVYQQVLPTRDERPARVPGRLEATLRKTRKLLLSPRAFISDAKSPVDVVRRILSR
ncbi:MAG: hypothetical protein JJ863_14990 [Deltaproteobacteria bacterium]|nr:hypothetical protein [Deltaproteobacteria bacterium]